jgi:hypothetical protein
MAIDNQKQANNLIKKMEESLPIPVYATPQLLKTMEKQGEQYKPDREFMIEKILYAGDDGGITCFLKLEPGQKTLFGVSLTHLKIGNDHPLAPEIQDYQKKRTIRLALEAGKTGKAVRLAKQSKKKKGFGNS